MEELLGAADVVTLHSPLTDDTRRLIDRDAIAAMRDGARLVNAARGALVDEDALVEAIRSGSSQARRSTSSPRSRTRGSCSSSRR